MKQLAIGLFLLSFVLSANPNGFAQTQEQLIAGAKKEGKLVVYASATAPQLQMYFATFNKRYPFIKTEFFRTGKQKLVSKILFEEQAKQLTDTRTLAGQLPADQPRVQVRAPGQVRHHLGHAPGAARRWRLPLGRCQRAKLRPQPGHR